MQKFYLQKKIYLLLSGFVIFIATIPFLISALNITSPKIWQPGVNPKTKDILLLNQFDTYYTGDTDTKKIYLTFNLYNESNNLQPLLNILKLQNIPASFFLSGDFIKSSPGLAQNIVQDGHTVGNLTATCPSITKLLDTGVFKNELTTNENLFKTATGFDLSPFYRPPDKNYTQENIKNAYNLGYTTIFWTQTLDQLPNHTNLMGEVISIDVNKSLDTTFLANLISTLKKQGYIFLDVFHLSNKV